MVQNDKLTKEINRLEGSVTELEQVEKELSLIANTENVDRLVYVVAETKRINEKMKVRKRNIESIINQPINLQKRIINKLNTCSYIYISSQTCMHTFTIIEKHTSQNCSTTNHYRTKN